MLFGRHDDIEDIGIFIYLFRFSVETFLTPRISCTSLLQSGNSPLANVFCFEAVRSAATIFGPKLLDPIFVETLSHQSLPAHGTDSLQAKRREKKQHSEVS